MKAECCSLVGGDERVAGGGAGHGRPLPGGCGRPPPLQPRLQTRHLRPPWRLLRRLARGGIPGQVGQAPGAAGPGQPRHPAGAALRGLHPGQLLDHWLLYKLRLSAW